MTLRSLPRFVLNPLLRHQARLHQTPLTRYHVRVARTTREYEDAFRLVHAGYVYQGLESVRASELRVTPQHMLPEAAVIVAYEGEQLVGTMTVILDSPAGLPLDKDYPVELDAMRRRGARLVEYGSFAIVERCWHSGVSTLLNIAAYRIANEIFRATHTVIGVAPHAAPFYCAVYDFTSLGRPRRHASLHTPVAGVVQNMKLWPRFCARNYQRPLADGHPIVAYFCGLSLPCIELPVELSVDNFTEWKMPREVYHQLFARNAQSNATGTSVISLATRRHRSTANSVTTNEQRSVSERNTRI